MKFKNIFRNAVSVLFLLTLIACGGGEEDPPPVDDGFVETPEEQGTGTFLFFIADQYSVADLKAVNPETGDTTLVDSGVEYSDITRVKTASYTAGGGLTDERVIALAYHKEGSLYRVNADLATGDTTPVRLSSETGLTSFNSGMAATDYANPDNSQYVYLATNVTTSWKMVTMGMTSLDAPVAAMQPILPLHDNTTGAITGWIAYNLGELFETDAAFGSPVSVLTGASSYGDFAVVASNGKVFYENWGKLYGYDPATDTNTEILTLNISSYYYLHQDTTHLYFRDQDAGDSSIQQIKRISVADYTVEQVTSYTVQTNESFEGIAYTDANVWISIRFDDGSVDYNKLMKAPKGAGATAAVVYQSANNSTGDMQTIFGSGPVVWVGWGGTSLWAKDDGTTSAPISGYLMKTFPGEGSLYRTRQPNRVMLTDSREIYHASMAAKTARMGAVGWDSGGSSWNLMAEPTNGRTLMRAFTGTSDPGGDSIEDIYLTPNLDTANGQNPVKVGSSNNGSLSPNYIGPDGCTLGAGGEVMLTLLVLGALGYQWRRRNATRQG